MDSSPDPVYCGVRSDADFFRRNARRRAIRKAQDVGDSCLQEPGYPGAMTPIRFMLPLLPISQGALVHTQDFPSLDGSHLQIKPAFFDVFADMPGMAWIMVSFPQVAVVLRFPLNEPQVTKRHR